MKVPPAAVVAGHICLDISPDLGGMDRTPFENVFIPGHLISSGPLAYTPGGSVSNTGLALHRLGIRTRLVARLGNDLPGRVLRQTIASQSKSLTRFLQANPGENTSCSVIINYPGADRIFIHDPGANDTFNSADIPPEIFKGAGLFHFGYPPVMRSVFQSDGRELARIFRQANGRGLITSLDLAFPDPASEAAKADWQVILAGALPSVDIFMPSFEEILFMLHRNTYQELCAAADGSDILPGVTPGMLSTLASELIQMGVGVVGLKLGNRGLYMRTADAKRLKSMRISNPARLRDWAGREFWCPCFQVDVGGTTGAGDATIAGFLAAFLRGCSLTECIQMAVAVGACCVEAGDSLGGVLPWEETSARIEKGWQKHSLEIHEPGWIVHSDKGFWERLH